MLEGNIGPKVDTASRFDFASHALIKKNFPRTQDNESSMKERKMPALRTLWLLIVLSLSNGNIKSAQFLVGAFTTSMPVSRFAIRTRKQVVFSMRPEGNTILTQEKIDSFRSGILALELPPPPTIAHPARVTLSPHFTNIYGSSQPDVCRKSGSIDEPRDSSSVGVPKSSALPSQDTEVLKEDLVVVASLINACEASVTAEQRELVHSFLSIAQLAARKSSTDRGDALGTPFSDFLIQNGWLEIHNSGVIIEQLEMNVAIHDQIVPILTKAFAAIPGAPVVGAASRIVNILQGLRNEDEHFSWLHLFQYSARRAYGADFQFSTTSIAKDNTIELDVVNVDFRAGVSIMHVLFVAFHAAHAQLEITKTKLSITPELLRSLGEALRKKVRPYVADEVISIEHK